ncbi:MAG: DUF192 domain-containing protein [Candidatus Omnitrophica bacterium]|nr:DUF192 domain-containing protein [Candidatus Omnitrophota bacterium]
MFRAVVIIFVVVTGFWFCPKTQASSSVCIKDTCVDVEVVTAMEDLQRGLQGRDSLSDNHGMLFVFSDDDYHRFWMKDMKFAIDMIWIDHQHHMVTIAPSCPPCTQEPCAVYTPSQKARYVLEVPTGFALKHHWKEGDTLQLLLGL